MSDAPTSAPAASAPSTPASSPAPSTPSSSGSKAPHMVTSTPHVPTIKQSATPEPRSSAFKDPAPTTPNSKFTEAPADGAPPAEATAEKKARKLALKIYGETKEFDVDNTPDEELTKYIQKGYAADKAFQERAETEKQARALIEAMAKDPFEAYKQITGQDLNELAKQRLIAQYEEANLPEADRERMKLQRQVEEYQARERAMQEQQQTAQQRQFEEQVFKQTEREMLETLEKHDLPKTQQTVRMLAEIARDNLEYGLELTPAQLAHEVKSRMTDAHKQFTAGLKGDQLLSYLGDDVVKEVLRVKVAQARRGSQSVSTPPAQTQSTEPKSTSKDWTKMSYAERKKFFKHG